MDGLNTVLQRSLVLLENLLVLDEVFLGLENISPGLSTRIPNFRKPKERGCMYPEPSAITLVHHLREVDAVHVHSSTKITARWLDPLSMF